MTGALGVIAFISTLIIVIVLHEFGHYIAAKKSKMKVEEFFLGFGPRLFSVRKGETEYGVKAFLLGGYVKIAGMNPWQPVSAEDAPRTFGARPAWQRAIVLVAGSTMHFILAFVVLVVMFGVVGTSDPDKPTTKIHGVSAEVADETGPAKRAGLRPGDQIVAIDGRSVGSADEVRSIIRTSAGTPLQMTIQRDGARTSVEVVPVLADAPTEQDPNKTEKVGQIGIVFAFEKTRMGPAQAVGDSLRGTGTLIVQSVKGVGTVFSPEGISRIFASARGSGPRSGDEEPVGPVGAGRLAAQAAEAGRGEDLVFFLVFFIVFIGVVNLVPLPPLDGGHLLVLAIEKVRGRKVDLRKVVPVATAVLAFLLIITVVQLYVDIGRPVTNPFQ